MKSSTRWKAAIVAVCFSTLFAAAQNKPKGNSPAPVSFTANYPGDVAGVLIESSEWTEIAGVAPSKMETKHGLAAALAYGLIPASAAAHFNGQHADVQLRSQRPVCVCRAMPVPGTPLLVKLHAKKGYRELDGGRLAVPGAKIAQAKQSDLVSVEVSQPETDVWLVRPLEPLPVGEYALMFGPQNFNVFPFTIADSSAESAVLSPGRP